MKTGIRKYLATGLVTAALFGAYTASRVQDCLAYRSNDPAKIEGREQAKRNIETHLDSAIPLALTALLIYPFIKKIDKKQNDK